MELQARLTRILKRGFRGSKVTVERTTPGSKKLCGILVWPKFLGVEQAQRQKQLWSLLDDALTPDERLRVTVILTFTPAEAVPVEDF